MNPDEEASIGLLYLENARSEMQRRYKKMRHVVSKLDKEQLNWRPNDNCNSVANLVVHFEGNIGARYLQTLGGQAFIRDRAAEFATDVRLTPAEALAKLDRAFPAAIGVIEQVSADRLTEQVHLPTGQADVGDFLLQTLIHYAEHVGQAILMAKAQGVDLGELPS